MIRSILARHRPLAALLAVAWLLCAQAELISGARGAIATPQAVALLAGDEFDGQRKAAVLPDRMPADQDGDPEDDEALNGPAALAGFSGAAGHVAPTRPVRLGRPSGFAQATGPPRA